MSRKVWGAILVLIAVIVTVINLYFFKSNEHYDLVRRVTYGLFILGFLLIPTYSDSKKGN